MKLMALHLFTSKGFTSWMMVATAVAHPGFASQIQRTL